MPTGRAASSTITAASRCISTASSTPAWPATAIPCGRLATASHDGLARCIDPVHTASDGDTMFALATGNAPGTQARALPLTVLGALVAEVTQRAVLNAVRAAVGVREPPLPSAQDLGWA